jgi:hypothetical protein
MCLLMKFPNLVSGIRLGQQIDNVSYDLDITDLNVIEISWNTIYVSDKSSTDFNVILV